MMKRQILVALVVNLFLCFIKCGAQITTYGIDLKQTFGEVEAAIYSIKMGPTTTSISIVVSPLKNMSTLPIYYSKNTYIETSNGFKLPIIGLVNRDGNMMSICEDALFRGKLKFDNVKKGNWYRYELLFTGRLPGGVTKYSLIDKGNNSGKRGYCFKNYHCNNPTTNDKLWNIEAVKENANLNRDELCGIYEELEDPAGYQYGCVKEDNLYKLIYLGSKYEVNLLYGWLPGDIKAVFSPTATLGIVTGTWNDNDKIGLGGVVGGYDGSMLNFKVRNKTFSFIKTYPQITIAEPEPTQWTGSGFALYDGYIVTNNHVVKNAKTIKVVGVNGDGSTEYNAKIIAVDPIHDLAVIRLKDENLKMIPNPSYAVSNRSCDVGEDIFVMGYPLTSQMGQEVKLTNGIISSRKGYQDDITAYQISAPIQPGNSGGPMFDENGNIVGIVNAGILDAENVGYAIKTSYLHDFINNEIGNSVIPKTNRVTGKTLSERVKSIKSFVYYIKCSKEAE